MDRRLIEAAQGRNVNVLRNLIKDDPLVLKTVALAGGETPLHIACFGGHVDFVKEILNWSPEFALELNQEGFSPLHIASANGYVEIVKEIITMCPDACLVKGKDRKIPLHYAVVKGRTEVIHELFAACLDAIEEVTARGENCFHLAVKHYQFEVFRILVDLAILHNKEQILNNKDERGNSILHLASYMKQYEVIRLLLDEKLPLRGKLELNLLNKRGLTPLDELAYEGGDSEIEEFLRLAGAERFEELNSLSTQTQHLSGSQSGQELREDRPKRPSRRLRAFFKYNKSKDTPTEVRTTLLLIAALIATATYTPVLSPPGGVWQDDFVPSDNTNISASNTSSRLPPPHTAGQAIMGTHKPVSYGLFLLFNSIGFFMALHMMYFLTHGLPMQFELTIALIALTFTYNTCMIALASGNNTTVLLIVISVVMPLLMPIFPMVVRDYWKPKWCARIRVWN